MHVWIIQEEVWSGQKCIELGLGFIVQKLFAVVSHWPYHQGNTVCGLVLSTSLSFSGVLGVLYKKCVFDKPKLSLMKLLILFTSSSIWKFKDILRQTKMKGQTYFGLTYDKTVYFVSSIL